MPARSSTDYYAARQQQERSHAKAASDPMIAAIHNDLADRYAALAAKPDAAIRPQLRIAQDA